MSRDIPTGPISRWVATHLSPRRHKWQEFFARLPEERRRYERMQRQPGGDAFHRRVRKRGHGYTPHSEPWRYK